MPSLHKHSYLLIFITFLWACGPSDISEDTEFLKAVRLGRTEQISEFLTQDPNLLNQKTDVKELTPLLIAAHKSDMETIEFLLEKGANLNDISKDGSTTLHFACENFMNAFAVSRILLEAGIDPSIKNNDGETAWDLVFKKKGKGRLHNKGNELLGLLLKYDYAPEMKLDENQGTLLHQLAEKAENPEIIRLLIEKHQLDPKARDAYGWTPLHYAAKGVNEEIAVVLMDNGADINAQSTKDRDKNPSKPNTSVSYKYPRGATPRDVYSKNLRGRRESLMRFFDQYGGKRSRDL